MLTIIALFSHIMFQYTIYCGLFILHLTILTIHYFNLARVHVNYFEIYQRPG